MDGEVVSKEQIFLDQKQFLQNKIKCFQRQHMSRSRIWNLPDEEVFHTARTQWECKWMAFVPENEFERSRHLRSTQKTGRGFKRSLCLVKSPYWHCSQDGYGSLRCDDPNDHSLEFIMAMGLCLSGEDSLCLYLYL